MKKKKVSTTVKKRDYNILLSMKGEINLSSKCTSPNKKAYSRKKKHKLSSF